MTNRQKLMDSFAKAYDDFSDAIFRHCYFRVFNRERAKELMQETFTKTWQYLIGGHEIDNLKAFLYRTAGNLIIDDSRKKKESSLDTLRESGFDPGSDDPNIQAKTDAALLMKVIDRLDEAYRDAVVMRYVDDMNPKEIAETLGVSANVVSVRIHRGLKMARKILAENNQK